MNEFHSTDSSHREKVLEHLFIGELLRCFWQRGIRDVDVLKSEVDRGGYDIVLESGGVIRHIQLKATYKGGKTAMQKISLNLTQKPSGCVVWIFFDPDSLELGPFLWLGDEPGKPLPPLGDRVAKHSKGNKAGYKAARPNLRVMNKGAFTALPSIGDVAKVLFQ